MDMQQRLIASLLQPLPTAGGTQYGGQFGVPNLATQAPNFSASLESGMNPMPRIQGGISAPAFGGQLGLTGGYQQGAFGPGRPEWSGQARFQRQF